MPSPTLRPAADGTFYAHWSDNRRSKRKSMGTANRALAERAFAQWLLSRDDVGNSDAIYTVAMCWEVYKTRHVDTALVSSGAELAWTKLEPHFGALTVGAIRPAHVERYTVTRGVQPQTVRKELAVLLAMLNFCAKRGMFASAMVPQIALPPAGEPRDRWLRLPEMQRLLTAARALRSGDRLSRGERFLWIALETAARVQAILDLTWDRVDFDANVIHFDVPGRAKTKKRRAAVSISSSLRPVLLRAYAERTGPLVMDHGGAIWATVQQIAVAAGFGVADGKRRATGISPHVLRHSAATAMARAGVPLWKIAKTLGNTLAMTERVYAKWAPDDPAGTVDMISKGLLEMTE